MILLPAIDLYEGKAVRLYQGDYNQMTVYSDNIPLLADTFREAGWIHMVDLEGAKLGTTPNFSLVAQVAKTGIQVEIGGGIRNEDTIKRYLDAGISRVILGTAALTDWDFLCRMVDTYKASIAVGVDCKDGLVAIRGWTEVSDMTCEAFFEKLSKIGVSTIICTDISRDGAMRGTNRSLYASLSKQFSMQLIASGGVSTLEDLQALRALDLYGAILGKAYYSGAISLKDALEAVK